ncbi:MAG TPA: GNAT family N-acetyltransferase [Clostridiaceae bacterium]|nr:GNAT family N-acetyltransferase [Clostridiaceae bacterium]
MLDDKIEIRSIEYDSDDYKQSRNLRHEVLRKPWGHSITEDNLDHEKNDLLLGAFSDNKLIGFGTLVWHTGDIAQVRYMAIDASWRKSGIGSKILSALEEAARVANKSKMILNSREKAIPFYEKHGYKVTGELIVPPFIPIPHAMMEKELN